MKRTLSLLLVLLMAFSACGFAETETEENDYFFGENVYGILNTGEEALADGMDPKWVLSQMKDGADLNDCADAYSFIAQNIAAYDNQNYRKIQHMIDRDDLRGISVDGATLSGYGNSIYEHPEVSDAMKALLQDSKAEYNFYPVWWKEEDFQSVLGTSYQNFKPTRSQPGCVCVVIKKGAQISPETPWEGHGDGMQEALYHTIDSLLWRLQDDGPVLTGNPNLASAFWVFDLTYSLRGYYGSEGDIKGYNTQVSLTVETADGKKKIASISDSAQLGNTIYSWSNYIAKAPVPDLSEMESYGTFVDSVRLALAKERSDAIASQKINAGNYQKKLTSLLLEQAEKSSDPWEKAIYQSAPQDVSWDSGTVTFRLRSYDPDLSQMVPYMRGENEGGWLDEALGHYTYNQLELSLRVITGVFTHSSLTDVKKAVTAAAKSARAAFESKDMLQAFKDKLFLAPQYGKPFSSYALLNPDDAFYAWASDISNQMPGYVPTDAVMALFAAQKSQKIVTDDGPRALALACVGADPEQLLSQSAKNVLDDLAFVSADERYGKGDSTMDLFTKALTVNAMTGDNSHAFTIPLDFSQGYYDYIPAAYKAFLDSFHYNDTLDELQDRERLLLDIPAVPFPKNGKMSGNTSGVQINLDVTEASNHTYVQLRTSSDDRIAATAFIHPGKSVTLYVPAGTYRIYYCSGLYWYNEDEMFGDLGSYNRSEPVQFKTGYIHSYTLETVDDGNTTTYKTDREAFKKKQN